MWPKKGEWRLLISLGVLFVIQMGTLNIGFDLTKGSIAAILISTNPLFAAFAAHFIIVDDRLSFRKAGTHDCVWWRRYRTAGWV